MRLLWSGDGNDFRSINDFAQETPWLHGVMTTYARYGVVLFALLLLAGWWVARSKGGPRRMARALIAPLGVLIAVAANQPLVHHVDEARPHAVFPHALLLVHASTDGSFPSDHATMAGAVAAGLLLVSVRLGLVASAAALLMAFARVYVGAHFPVDVVAGLAFGALVALVVSFIATPLVERLVTRMTAGRLAPLLRG